MEILSNLLSKSKIAYCIGKEQRERDECLIKAPDIKKII